MTMQLAISSWSLHRHMGGLYHTGRDEKGRKHSVVQHQPKDLDVLDFPATMRDRYGVSAVEIVQVHIPTQDEDYVNELRSALDGAGVQLVNMPIDVGDISSPNPDWRAEDLDEIRNWIDVAAALGSPCARVNSGHGNMETAIASYRELTAYGAQVGVKILLENHGGLSAEPANIQRIVEGVASEWFGLCPDFGNFSEDVRYDGLALMLPYAAVIHAKTYDFDAQGRQTHFDFERCLRMVTDSGFDGPLSIEFEGQGDAWDGIRRSVELVTQLLPDVR